MVNSVWLPTRAAEDRLWGARLDMSYAYHDHVSVLAGTKTRWDRNRTGTLRLWSLLPFVQQRSGRYISSFEIAHTEGPKYQDVHQSSPALGSELGSLGDTGAGTGVSRLFVQGSPGPSAEQGIMGLSLLWLFAGAIRCPCVSEAGSGSPMNRA
jgi:hypothetical protein